MLLESYIGESIHWCSWQLHALASHRAHQHYIPIPQATFHIRCMQLHMPQLLQLLQRVYRLLSLACNMHRSLSWYWV